MDTTRYSLQILPEGDSIEVTKGMLVMEALQDAGYELETPCGGKGLCGKCRVRVKGAFSPPDSLEKKHLEPGELKDGWRLACRARIEGTAVVNRPEETGQEQILTTDRGRKIAADPVVSKKHVILDTPTLEDQRSDLDRLRDALRSGEDGSEGKLYGPDLDLMQELPYTIRKSDFSVTGVLHGRELIAVEEGDTADHMYGMAFDIGTTTVVGTLIDLNTGREIATSSALNSQGRHGADLISRINFAGSEQGGLAILREEVIGVLNGILSEAAERAGIDHSQIYEATVVGNTCMTHILLGLPPEKLAASPYVTVVRDPVKIRGSELEIDINPRGKIYVLPTIGGYVGADTVGVIVSTFLEERNEPVLAIDIGTNGEIVLGSERGLMACSTAAGPAFEGAQITHGMRGREGAIEAVEYDGDLTISVIGDQPPVGICGSGLIDTVAVFIRLGIIDKTGKIRAPQDLGDDLPEAIVSRLVEGENGYEFILVDEKQSGRKGPVKITQKDLRELQLAKGAINAGVEILMDAMGISKDDLSEVLLAGAFGNYIRRESARTLGLIPDLDLSRIHSVGNAASSGAKMALLSRPMRDRAEKISKEVEYMVLASSSQFQQKFMMSMYFPVD